MTRRNIGRFSIIDIDTNFREAQVILAKLVVVRAEMIYHRDAIEYTAIGDAFAAVDEGDEIPWYDAVLHYDGMGGVRLMRWDRRR